MVNRLKTKRNESIFDSNEAEKLAISAFGFLAGEPEHFSRFAMITGVDIADITEIADSKEFLTAVLGFLLGDEQLLLNFCQINEVQPEKVDKTYQFLSRDY